MKPFARILERDGVQVVVIADRCDRSDNDEIKMLFDPDVEGIALVTAGLELKEDVDGRDTLAGMTDEGIWAWHEQESNHIREQFADLVE